MSWRVEISSVGPTHYTAFVVWNEGENDEYSCIRRLKIGSDEDKAFPEQMKKERDINTEVKSKTGYLRSKLLVALEE